MPRLTRGNRRRTSSYSSTAVGWEVTAQFLQNDLSLPRFAVLACIAYFETLVVATGRVFTGIANIHNDNYYQ